MTTPQHTPGPLETNKEDDWRDGYDIKSNQRADFIATVHQHETPEETEFNTRLLAAAYNSYDKHCGTNAVECAEGDLLGDLIKACKFLLLECRGHDVVGGSFEEEFLHANATIAKATKEQL